VNRQIFKPTYRIAAALSLVFIVTFAFVWTRSTPTEQLNKGVQGQRTIAEASTTKVVTLKTEAVETEASVKITSAGAQGSETLKRYGALEVPAGEEQASVASSPRVALVADFDADNINDLLVAHNDRLVLQRGNVNAFAPQTQAAWEAIREGRFVSPFERSTYSTSVPVGADFILSGDFNRDARLDAAFAARGDNSLYILEGDGKGSFSNLRRIETVGAITTLATGDVNRADGLADLIVGTRSADGGFGLQIFSSSVNNITDGSLFYNLPSAAEAIAVGQLDENAFADIAVAAGNDIIILSGAVATEPGVTPPAEMQLLPQQATVKSLVVGDFLPDRDNRAELALLTQDGGVRVLKRGVLDTAPITRRAHLAAQVREYQAKGYPVPERILRQLSAEDLRQPAPHPKLSAKNWSEADAVFSTVPNFAASAETILTKGQFREDATEDLIVLDSSANRVLVLPFVTEASETAHHRTFVGKRRTVGFSVKDRPLAVLPMRLNHDTDLDLLVINQNQANFGALVSAPLATFTVTTPADDIDSNLGDGFCNGPSGCTLRAAIMEANRLAGDDVIMINAGINPVISRGQPDNDAGATNDQASGDLDITCVIANPAIQTCAPLAATSNDLSIIGAAGKNTVSAGTFTPYVTNGGPITTDRVFDIGQDGIFGGGFGGSTGVTVSFSNLIIENGNVREALVGAPVPGYSGANYAFGGGIRYDGFGNAATHGSLTLTNTTINNNQSDNAGGGVYQVYGTFNATGSTFSSNITKAGEGGGLFFGAATSNSNVNISNSTFNANEARKGIVFGTPTANADGGGLRINADPNTVTITNTNFTNNIAQQDGGAIKTLGAQVTVTGGSITGNTARRHGGGIFGDADPPSPPDNIQPFFTLSGSTVRNNTANSDNSIPGDDFGFAGDGGAIFRERGTLNLINATIGGTGAGEPNTATNGGGVAHGYTVTSGTSNTATVNINGGSINGNIANTDGGGVYFNAQFFTTTASTLNIGQTTATALDGNKAKNNGGGIHISNGAIATLNNMTLRSNQANSDNSGGGGGDGGAFYQNIGTTTFTGTLTIGGSGFANSAANGGGIGNAAGTLTLPNNSSITFNTATVNGGGINNGGTINFNGGTVDSNSGGTGDGLNQFSGTFNGSNTISFNNGDSINLTGGTFTSTSGTLNLTGNFTNSGATFNHNNGTVIFNGTAAQSLGGTTSSTFNNLTVNKTGTLTLGVNTPIAGNLTITNGIFDLSSFTANRTAAGGTLTVSDGTTLKIGGTGTLPSNFSTHSIGATSTIEYSGTNQTVATLNSAQKYGNLVTSGSGTKTLAGATVIATSLTIGANTTLDVSASNHPINFSGTNWTNNGTFTPRLGTVTFDATGGTQALSGNTTFYNLTLSNSNTTTNFGSTTTTIGNTFRKTAGTMNGGTSTFIFTGTPGAANGITGSSGKNFFNLQINSGANISTDATAGNNLTIDGNFTNAGTFTQDSTRTTTFGANGTQNFSGVGTTTFGNFTIQSTSTVNAGSHSFSVKGSTFTATGTFTGNTSTVTFNGAAQQTITGNGTKNFSGLTINNPISVTVSNDVTANNVDASVSGALTLTTDLTVAPGAIIQQSGTSAGARDVIGTVRRTDLGASPKPFGNLNNTITINSGTAPNPMDVTLAKVTPAGFPGSIPVVPRTYSLTPTGGSGINATVKLRYIDPAETASVTESRLILWKNIGGTWTAQGGAVDTVNDAVSLSGVTSFSDWAIAEGSDLTITKANSVGNNAVTGQPWTWTLTVNNTGAPATFNSGATILTDNLPNTNITYGAVTVSNQTNITNPGNISCSITSNDLTCTANGGSVTMNGPGSFQVSFTATPLAVGTFTNPRAGGMVRVDSGLEVVESNDGNNDATSNTVTVTKANTTTGLTSSQDPSVFGQQVTFTATIAVTLPGAGSPTGTVQFLDGVTPITGCTAVALSAGQATCQTSALSVGNHTMSAQFSGDSNFNSSTGNMTGNPQVVNKADTTTGITSSQNPSVFGQSVSFTATVAAVSPGAGTLTGTVEFLDGVNPITGCTGVALSSGQATCQTSALSVGNHTITAQYSGDSNFNTSTGNMTGNPQVVNKADSSVGLTSSQNPSTVGDQVTFTATVAVTAPGAGSPTGTVEFLDGGNPIAGCTGVALSAGQATCQTSALSGGDHTITAQYSGDTNFNTSTGSLTGNPQVVIIPINQPPVNTVPGALNIPQNTVLTFTGSNLISVADADAAVAPGDGVITVSLTATNGILKLSGTAGLTFNSGSDNSAAMSFDGTIAAINTALNGMTFTPTSGFTGAASVQIVSNDQGKTGPGGAKSDDDTVQITVSEPSVIYINEVLFNPPGVDAPNEYIELRGPANAVIPAGTYFVAIEGDSADNTGDVQTIINLSGLTFGSNGFLVLLQNGNTYTTAAGATVITSTTTGFGGLPGAIFQADAAATDIEDDSVTFMLVQTGVAPTLTDDIDSNNDATPDGSAFAGWSVRDSIGVLNATAGALGYGAINYHDGASGASTPGSTVVTVSFTAAYVGRIGDSTGSAATDWVASIPAGSQPNFTLGTAGQTEPASFAGKPLNHIGASNFVNLPPVNSVPAATQNVNEDTTLTFNAGNSNLISISDPDAGTASVQVTLTVTGGTISLSGTAGLTFTVGDGTSDTTMTFTGTIANINTALTGLTYTPTLNYSGPATLTIETNDQGNTGNGGAQSDTDVINISVGAINDAPSFTKGADQIVNEDAGAQTVTNWATSISQGAGESGQTLTFTVTGTGMTGNLAFTSGPAIDPATGTLTYTTSANTNGTATISVTLSDNGSNVAPNSNTSAAQTFTITVGAVNDAPSFQIASNPPAVGEDPGAQTVNSFATNFQPGPATATDEAGQTLVGYTVTQTGTTGNLSFTSGPSINNAGQLTYTPTTNTSGTATFNVVATDSGSSTAPNVNQSAPVSFTITVTGQNDAPVLDNTSNMSLTAINEDVANASNTGTLISDIISSAGGDRITDIDPTPLEGIAVTAVNNTNGTWQYTIDNGTNWLPFGSPDQTTARLLAADATTRVRFIPAANFNDTVNPGLTFRAWDQTSGTNGSTADVTVGGGTTAFSLMTETASITVNPVNDTPTANAQVVGTAEDTPVGITLTGTDIETASGSLVYTVTVQPANGTLTGTGANRTYTPNANFNGADSFQFTVTDTGDGSSPALASAAATVTINVGAVNDAPVADAQSATTNEDSPKAITLTGSDLDTPAGSLTYTIVTGPANGVLSGTGANRTYTPNANYNGSDSFTFKINDGTADSNTATVSITVNPVNDTPTGNAQAVTTNEDTPKAITLTGTDTETASGSLVYTVTVQPTNGVLSGTGANRTYTPNLNYTGPDTFQFTVTDTGDGSSAALTSPEATVSITVSGVNDGPVNTMPGTQSVIENQTLTFSAANSNLISIVDLDAGANPVQVTLTATNGTITLSSNAGLSFTTGDGTADAQMTFTGTITNINTALNGLVFTPTPNYDGAATLQITTSDQGNTGTGGVLTDTDTININVIDGGVLAFSSTTYTVAEGAGTATITVNRTGGSSGEARVAYTTSNGTATAGSDYTTASGTLIFASGETTRTFTVAVTNDSLDEPDETVTLTLSNAAGTGSLGAPITATLTITDDDLPPGITINDVSVTEGNSGTTNAVFTVTLSAPSGLPVSVNYATANGTATAPSDYTAIPSTVLTFLPGETVKTITVLVNGDTLAEANENFFINLSNPVNSAISDAQGQGTITSDDTPLIGLSASTYSVGEGDLRASITVNRLGDLSQVARVDYLTTDTSGLNLCSQITGNASGRCDYATTAGTLRFAAGETSKVIHIPIVDDVYLDGPEVFTLTLSNEVGAELGGPVVATITIIDNDTTPSANPIDTDAFFIRQLYIDFLGREPEPGAVNNWLGILNHCAIPTDCDRIAVARGFVRSPEFQDRGFFVYRTFKTLGRIALYNEFIPDMAKLSGFLSAQDLEANKAAYVEQFMNRQEFKTLYDSSLNNPTAYVDKLLQSVQLPNHPGRNAWVAGLTNATLTRAQVLRQLIESNELYTAYVNEAFIIMNYFGFLRRSADASYLTWIDIFNHTNDDRVMINGFLNSLEYRLRFGP
jgi:CSLREA domain-containing protein